MVNPSDDYQVFNYADKPDLSARELISNIEDSLQVSVPSFRIPYGLGMLGGYGFDFLSKISGRKLPVSSVGVKKFCATTKFDAFKVHRMAFDVPYSMDEAL